MTVERSEYRHIISLHDETTSSASFQIKCRKDLRCTKSHTPEDSFLVNEEGFPDGLLVFLGIRFSSCGKIFDVDSIIVQMLLVMLEDGRHGR
jgi:hypothetical protein